MIKRAGATHWYHPVALLWTAYRVATAENVAGMFDRRELMAALDPFDAADFNANYDLSKEAEVWLDYIADTGDGWRGTHAVARLLAAETLLIGEEKLPRGQSLVIGGDLIYPTPSSQRYSERLNDPFVSANRKISSPGSDQAVTGVIPGTTVYALPGNHDWYDGLTAFAQRFCARRPARGKYAPKPGHLVCGRKTSQTRSYFALKLPGNWWLCAVDVQLGHRIDDEQLAYFTHLARNVMTEGSDILLCVPAPEWLYVSGQHAHRGFEGLSYMVAVLEGRERTRDLRTRRHRVRALLSGDTHNYTRYEETLAHAGYSIHYIACGLGGAFTHPTSWNAGRLRFRSRLAPPGKNPPQRRDVERILDRQEAYPTGAASSLMAVRNVAFGFLNWEFSAATAIVCLISAWLVAFGATLLRLELFSPDPQVRWATLATVALASPWLPAAALGVVAAATYFASARGLRAWAVGSIHGAVHVLLWGAAIHLFSGLSGSAAVLLALMAAWGFLVPPLTFGIYLIIALLVFGAHWNEAFSSLRIVHYKGLLRLRFSSNGSLDLYPIGCDHVPLSDDAPLRPRLIEPKISLRRPGRS